jgi:type II secretory pathway pseudopilin PulG
MLSRLRRAAAGTGGFTIVELLITMTLGLIVTGASVAVLTTALKSADQTTRRSDALQNGRAVLDQVVRVLRSQVCPDPIGSPTVTPVVAGNASSVTFYAQLGDGTGVPQKHVLSLASGRLTDQIYNGSQSGTSAPTWSASPDKTRMLGDNLAQSGTTPVFQYYGYTGSPATASAALPSSGTTLASTDLPKVARIVITLQANPNARSGSSRQSVTVSDEVFVRLVDPNGTTPVATCT